MSHHLQPAEAPITADNAFLEEILNRVNLPTIMIGERFGEWLRDGLV